MENILMTNTGMWIDVQKAVIVSVTGGVVEIESVKSELNERQWQFAVWEIPTIVREKMLVEHLDRFYMGVSRSVLNANSIYIFGPGRAKSEFRKRLHQDKYRGSIIGVETTEAMTDLQIVNKVYARFEEQRFLESLGISNV